MKLTVSKKSMEVENRLYLIEFRDDTGYYVKCGKSSGIDSTKRLMTIMESYITAHKGACAYAKILRDVSVTEVFKREAEFHTRFKDRRHYPLHSFSGYTELFSLTKEEALLAFDEIIGKEYGRDVTKVCFTCKVEKSTIDFHTNNAKTDKLNHECKECVYEKQRGFSTLPYRIYRNQIEHSKMRGHPAPAYTYEEFKVWILNQDTYETLYTNYKNSGYDKNLVPSVDRKNPLYPYTFDNIELVTFSENMRRNGESNVEKLGRPVQVINKYTGEMIGTFKSQNAAAVCLGISSKKICSKVDTVTAYGWLATIGDFQIISEDKTNYFISNGYLKDEFRYKGKGEDINASEL